MTLQNVAVKANLVAYIIEELEKDAEAVRDKLKSTTEFIETRMNFTRRRFHTNLDDLLKRSENRVKAMHCKEDTMNELNAVREYGWDSFVSCANWTTALHNAEMIVCDAVDYLWSVAYLLSNITIEIATCRHSSLFQGATCVVYTIAKHADDYKQKTETILSLIARLESVTVEVVSDFSVCIESVESKVFRYIDDVIAKNCKPQPSFFSKFFNAIKSNFFNTVVGNVTEIRETQH